MDLSLIIAIAAGLLAGAVAALQVIAPKTANTTDDAVLARLAALEELVKNLVK